VGQFRRGNMSQQASGQARRQTAQQGPSRGWLSAPRHLSGMRPVVLPPEGRLPGAQQWGWGSTLTLNMTGLGLQGSGQGMVTAGAGHHVPLSGQGTASRASFLPIGWWTWASAFLLPTFHTKGLWQPRRVEPHYSASRWCGRAHQVKEVCTSLGTNMQQVSEATSHQ
jgi:hypothetical protein